MANTLGQGADTSGRKTGTCIVQTDGDIYRVLMYWRPGSYRVMARCSEMWMAEAVFEAWKKRKS